MPPLGVGLRAAGVHESKALWHWGSWWQGFSYPRLAYRHGKGPADSQTVLCPQLHSALSWVRGYESEVIRFGEEMAGKSWWQVVQKVSEWSALLCYPHFHLSFESQSDTIPTLKYIQLLLPACQLLFIPSTVVLDAALWLGAMQQEHAATALCTMLSSFSTIWGWGKFPHDGSLLLCAHSCLTWV